MTVDHFLGFPEGRTKKKGRWEEKSWPYTFSSRWGPVVTYVWLVPRSLERYFGRTERYIIIK